MLSFLRLPILEISLSLLIAGTLSSCVTSNYARYPSEWGRLSPAKRYDCPELVGTYLNEAEEADDNPPRDRYDPVLLSTLLFPSLADMKVSAVTINQPDGTSIEMVLKGETTILFRTTLSRDNGDFSCSPKHVVITGRSRPPTEGDILVRKVEAYLTKTEDGSLAIYVVVRDRGIGLLVIPYSFTRAYWYRFKRQGT